MRIAVVTGSRADWGLLLPVLRAMHAHPDLQALTWVTGSHLEARFGNTAQQIERDGFRIDAAVPLNIATDSPRDTAAALSRAIDGFAGVIADNRPDLILVLGDRYEIFGAVQAAALAAVPVAHIAGGDISEGAYDDGMRHAISKLSQLHFPTNPEARDRLLQMGEAPDTVILAGSPGIDNILATQRLDRTQIEQRFGYHYQKRNLLVSFHPATLADQSVTQQIGQLLQALQQLPSDIGLLLSGSNADHGGEQINKAFAGLAATREHTHFVTSFGNQGYYSVLAEADLLLGNSSSGLYEAPTLRTPALDIGQRQQGRLRGLSVAHCANQATAIVENIERLLADPPQEFPNPYGDGKAAEKIIQALASLGDPAQFKRKQFNGGRQPCAVT